MKKIILSTMLIATLVSSVFISASATEIKDINKNTITVVLQNKVSSGENVKETLKNYFSKNLESEKQLKALKNDSIEENSNLATLNNLEYKLKAKVNNKYKLKLENFSSNVEITSIVSDGDLIKVYANNKVTCKYNSSNDESSYLESHVLYLKQVDKKLLVEKDIESLEGNARDVDDSFKNTPVKKSISNSSSSVDNYDTYIQNQINKINDKLKNTDKYFPANTNKNTLASTTRSHTRYKLMGSGYDGIGAANWALSNVYSAEDYQGNDCTNFVSKALFWGGHLTQDVNYGWCPSGVRWIRVEGLWEFLSPIKGYVSDYLTELSTSCGDVVQLYNENRGVFSHSVIVTRKYETLGTYVSAHTNAAYNVPLTHYTTNPTYTTYRCLCFNAS